MLAWVDGRLLMIGGDDGPPCPPLADCPLNEMRRDGAAYDPASARWEPIAEAPVAIPGFAPAVVAGDDDVFVLLEEGLFSYDPQADDWARHPSPGRDEIGGRLTAVGGRPALVPSERSATSARDRVYDPAKRTWKDLPVDPIGPAFDRVYTETPDGAVLTARELVPKPGSLKPAVVLAARLSPDLRTWTRLSDSDQLGGNGWAWTGTRMVDPTLGSADGGYTNNWGRSVPYGGIFDPAADRWERLPDPPRREDGGWDVTALGGPVSASGGWFHDDRSGSWTRIVAPPGAPDRPGAATWADTALYVVGGVHEDESYPASGKYEAELSGAAWVYSAGDAN